MQATQIMKNSEPLATHSSISEMYVANNHDNQLTITEGSRTSYTAPKKKQTDILWSYSEKAAIGKTP